jgi:hypothetical protein
MTHAYQLVKSKKSNTAFKTLKYRPEYPSKPFADLEALRLWVSSFVLWYNHEHKHSALRYVTPIQRHTGDDIALLKRRTMVYQQAKRQHPNRWSNEIRDWSHQQEVHLNPSQNTKTDEIIVGKNSN